MIDRKSLGARSRKKGHEAELYYVNLFKDLGFNFCCTSRLGSKLYDNAKIDIMNIPFNIQVKAGVQTGLNAGKELFNMESIVKASFLPIDEIHNRPKLLIHKKAIGRGGKKTDEHEMVFMSYTQFLKFKEENPTIEYIKEKKFRATMTSEFGHIVSMTFAYFRDNILLTNLEQYKKNYATSN